ncbi:hypothetical protein [Romboutsia sp. 1001713B170207_170306_H8]|uniref:hypothetical protein n=1 Tax=Romboutsia sp. 1001713B170207_170306_H8 TaxID=2787112 RepID=UPI0018987D05|nr:hypothetical protein [Romboutsia sp. 1001713B170207_170306_H8]
MNSYKYKHHAFLSIIISGIIGALSFFIIKPTMITSITGELISRDSGQSIIQYTTYGYNAVFTVIIISFIIMLFLYKPIKKIIFNPQC